MQLIVRWIVCGVMAAAGAALAATAPSGNVASNAACASVGENRVILGWDEFKKVTNWDERKADTDKKESGDLVIPWDEVRDLLHVEVKDVQTAQVKLPWKEFKKLLEWSVKEAERKKAEKATEEEAAPVPYVITSAEYEGKDLTKDGATFAAKFEIEVFQKKGWKQIPILPATVAVREAKLPEGVSLQLSGSHYQLLTKNAGKLAVEAIFAVAVVEAGGAHRLQFNKVPSSTCILDITVPSKDLDVNVAMAQSKLAKQVGEATKVVAAIPANTPVDVSWQRAIPEADKVPPKLYSETQTLLSVADGLLLGHAQVTFSILHTATRQLAMNVPAGVSILEVAGANLRDWRAAEGRLTLQLDKEVIGTYYADVKYEAPLATMTGQTPIPVITAAGVEREKGHIGVVALSNVEISTDKIEGAHAMDAKDLPAQILGMTAQPVLLAFRYVVPKFDVRLAISKHKDMDVLLTVVDRALFTVMQTADGRRISRAVYTVRNNRNQFLRLDLPEGSELWSASVAGRSTQPAKDEKGRLLLPLVRSESAGALRAFPVELVYVEKGSPPDERGRGTAKVELPACAEPIVHLMVNLYVPAAGKYKSFEGTLREVKTFTVVGHAGGPVAAEASRQAEALQQAFQAKNAQAVAASGARPIEVELPLSGQVFRLEKILVVKDKQWFSYVFSGLEK